MGAVVGEGTCVVVDAGGPHPPRRTAVGIKVVVLVVLEVQAVRPCTLPDKGKLVLEKMHGLMPVMRMWLWRILLGLWAM